ncbi:MAG TPA: hypothetical protein DCE71_06910 [Parachlamydiales bacterium]|nr:hypothetical protein [Parachlamydiales bacterium]
MFCQSSLDSYFNIPGDSFFFFIKETLDVAEKCLPRVFFFSFKEETPVFCFFESLLLVAEDP